MCQPSLTPESLEFGFQPCLFLPLTLNPIRLGQEAWAWDVARFSEGKGNDPGPKSYLEGQGDSVSGLILGITKGTIWFRGS